MKLYPHIFTKEVIHQIIILKWHRLVDNPNYPSYVSNDTLGKVYGISARSIRELYMKRFSEMPLDRMRACNRKKRAPI